MTIENGAAAVAARRVIGPARPTTVGPRALDRAVSGGAPARDAARRPLHDVGGELYRGASHRLRYRLEAGLKLQAHGAEELIQVPRQLLGGRRCIVVCAEDAADQHVRASDCSAVSDRSFDNIDVPPGQRETRAWAVWRWSGAEAQRPWGPGDRGHAAPVNQPDERRARLVTYDTASSARGQHGLPSADLTTLGLPTLGNVATCLFGLVEPESDQRRAATNICRVPREVAVRSCPVQASG
jgi:hypothetical protein